MNSSCIRLLICLLLVSTITLPAVADQSYKFSGGPDGGVFMHITNAITHLAKENKIKINQYSSNGSIENIRKLNSGKADFAIAYSCDVFLAQKGLLTGDPRKYENIRVIGYLYSAPAQMVVRNDGTIRSLRDLAGKKVGVGDAGSGAAFHAERMFTELNIWHKMRPHFMGYNSAATSFQNKQLDAFWIFSGYPNSAIYETALKADIKLLDLWGETEIAGIPTLYPFYKKAIIPANTYKGQTEPVSTIQDSALWIASKDVSEQAVYDLLKTVYSANGLKYMSGIHSATKGMNINSGLDGVITTLHPGAERFWIEKGIIVK